MTESDRPMTPFDYSSSGKLLAARPTTGPIDPFAGLPRIPRSPRVPTDVGKRDTEPVSAAPTSHDELTPPDGPFGIRQVLKKLGEFDVRFQKMEALCQRAADCSMETRQLVSAMTGQINAINRRVTILEAADRWVPAAAWLITTVIALWALLRTYR